MGDREQQGGFQERILELFDTFSGLSAEDDAAGAVARLFEVLEHAVDADTVAVCVRRGGAIHLLARESREGALSADVESLLDECNEVVLEVMKDGRARYIPDLRADSRYTVPGEEPPCQYVVPLRVRQQVEGSLDVRSTAPDRFSDDDRRLVDIAAALTATALHNLRIQEQLRQERNRLETLIESSADAIITTDDRGILTLFSPGAQEIFGYRAEEVIGTPVAQYYYRGKREAQRVMERLRAQGKIKNYETWFRSKSGRGIPASLSTSLIYDRDGNITGTLGVLKDITRQKEMEEKLNYTIEQLQEANEKLEVLAVTDNLSGLYNHRYFYRELEEEMERSFRTRRPLSVLLIDIDKFKDFNDTYGHQIGDQIIEEIGRIVRKSIRRVDTGCRYGGEEFTVILPETGLAQAEIVADRICTSFRHSPLFSELKIRPTTLSIGVATFDPKEGRLPTSDVVRAADEAMYEAKRAGGDAVALSRSS